VFNAWANLEMKMGKVENARDILLNGIKEYPNDHSLFQAAGKVEERSGNYTVARDFYAASLRLEPSAPALVAYALLELNHPEPLTMPTNKKAKTSSSNVNISKIRKLFEEALLLDPRHGPAYNAYGNMELRRGNLPEARVIFERGVQAKCNDPASVYHGFAKVELSVGNVQAAKEILVEGLQKVNEQETIMMEIKHGPSTRDRATFLVHTLGMLELKRNRVVDAKDVFQNGIERYGNSSRLLLGSALCEVRLGKEASARTLFERAVLADKTHAHAWQAWGVMEMRAGDYRVAQTLFECGIQSAPKHGALWQAYATMESRLGRLDEARVLFAAGVEKSPRHVPLYQAWACLELRAGNFYQAKRLIGEALTRDKTQGSGWLVAAEIEKKQGNDGIVGLILRRGLECAPNHPELYCALAEYQIECGKMDDARNVLEKGLEVDPFHAPLYHSLAELEARVFNIEGLAKLNKRAAQVFNNNALIPPPDSTRAWGKKLKMRRSREIPPGVAALAEKVVGGNNNVEIDEALAFMDPVSLIESMSQFEELDVLFTEMDDSGGKS